MTKTLEEKIAEGIEANAKSMVPIKKVYGIENRFYASEEEFEASEGYSIFDTSNHQQRKAK